MALKMLRSASALCEGHVPTDYSRPFLGDFPGNETSLRSFFFRYNILPAAMYDGWHTVTMIPGDGIGPELHVKNVSRHACVPRDFEEVKITPLLVKRMFTVPS